jgi:AraC-like DNA-binding protein
MNFGDIAFGAINLVVAVLCLLSLFVLLFNIIGNKNRNVYFLIILAIGFFIRAFYSWNLFNGDVKQLIYSNFGGTYLIFPVYHFFFKKAYNIFISNKELLLYFSAAFFFSVFHFSGALSFVNNKYLYLVFSIIALLSLVRITSRAIDNKETFHSGSRKKFWLIMMLVLTGSLVFVSNISFYLYEDGTLIYIIFFFNFSSLIWLFVLARLFLNPEVLYGAQLLDKIIKETKVNVFEVWVPNINKIIDSPDQKLHMRLKTEKNYIIEQIDTIISEEIAKGIVISNALVLKTALNIPMVHLDYVFKYYCKYSKNDFFNYVKIKYAISLLETGYLNTKTVETLASDSFFDSKTTFYNNFKKFTGKSPTKFYQYRI